MMYTGGYCDQGHWTASWADSSGVSGDAQSMITTGDARSEKTSQRQQIREDRELPSGPLPRPTGEPLADIGVVRAVRHARPPALAHGCGESVGTVRATPSA